VTDAEPPQSMAFGNAKLKERPLNGTPMLQPAGRVGPTRSPLIKTVYCLYIPDRCRPCACKAISGFPVAVKVAVLPRPRQWAESGPKSSADDVDRLRSHMAVCRRIEQA